MPSPPQRSNIRNNRFNGTVRNFIKPDMKCSAKLSGFHCLAADDEYIPFREDIEGFQKGETAKPIIHREDSRQVGYEILPNKYFYRHQPPRSAKELLAKFWKLEKDAEEMLEGLAR
jgi:type I restriction enzyme M protein